jgi:hypothetical protein
VVSISSGSGSGSRVAAVSFKEGPLGGPGMERVVNVGFWPGGETDLVRWNILNYLMTLLMMKNL